MPTTKIEFPLRINKYLAHKKLCTRREGDELIKAGKVLINGKKAVLGDQVRATDDIKILFRTKKYRYYAYNKPRGIITHSPGEGEKDIQQSTPLKGVFPIGRLDKDSHGLMILTDDGRITDALLHPDYDHEKEYLVTTRERLPGDFKERLEGGIEIEGYMTRPCVIKILGEKRFSITLTEGKKHQIRRMVAACNLVVDDLERVRVMNIQLGRLQRGAHREISGNELAVFLRSLGM